MTQIKINYICRQNLLKIQSQYRAYIDSNALILHLRGMVITDSEEVKKSLEEPSRYYLPLSEREASCKTASRLPGRVYSS